MVFPPGFGRAARCRRQPTFPIRHPASCARHQRPCALPPGLAAPLTYDGIVTRCGCLSVPFPETVRLPYRALSHFRLERRPVGARKDAVFPLTFGRSGCGDGRMATCFSFLISFILRKGTCQSPPGQRVSSLKKVNARRRHRAARPKPGGKIESFSRPARPYGVRRFVFHPENAPADIPPGSGAGGRAQGGRGRLPRLRSTYGGRGSTGAGMRGDACPRALASRADELQEHMGESVGLGQHGGGGLGEYLVADEGGHLRGHVHVRDA